jgi:hypothetical protein
MQDVPITFMGEIDGEVYRVETTKVFQHEQHEVKNAGGIKRTNSQVMMALQNTEHNDDGEYQNVITTSGVQTTQLSTPKKTQEDLETPDSTARRGLHRVRSSSQLAAVAVESNGSDLKLKEEQFKANVGPR